jgi:hypothetical protein
VIASPVILLVVLCRFSIRSQKIYPMKISYKVCLKVSGNPTNPSLTALGELCGGPQKKDQTCMRQICAFSP